MAEANCVPVAEAARRLEVSSARVRQLLDGGELAPMLFPGGRRLVSEASLRRLIAEREAKRGQGVSANGTRRS